jgi:hypothetical protein
MVVPICQRTETARPGRKAARKSDRSGESLRLHENLDDFRMRLLDGAFEGGDAFSIAGVVKWSPEFKA